MPWIGFSLLRAIVIAAGFVWIAPASALPIAENLLFGASSQSQWTSGAAVDTGTGGPQFFGVPGFSKDLSVGTVEDVLCTPLGCLRAGAQIGARVSGRAGLDYEVKINNGSLTVTFPQRLVLSIPDPTAVLIGQPFEIKSTLGPATIWTFSDTLGGATTIVKPTLQTTGPTVQALLGMDLQAQLFAGAEVCAGLCYGPALNVGFSKQQELLALNSNNDGQVRILGDVVLDANISQTYNNGTISLTAQLPVLNSDSRVSGGFDGALLRSGERSNVLGLTAQLDKIVSDLLGLPPLHGNTSGIGYNLITANAGISIDVTQQFTFDPDLKGILNFSHPVVHDGITTSSVAFTVGDTMMLRAPGALSLGVLPVYNLENDTRNDTGLRVDGNIFVSAGGASASAFGIDIGIGPLFRESSGGGLTDIPLAGVNFQVNMPTVRTDPFNIVFGLPRSSTAPADIDPCLAVGGCDKSGYFGVVTANQGDTAARTKDVYKVGDLYRLVDTSPLGNDCVRFDSLGRPCDTTRAEQLVFELLALEDTELIGGTNPFLLDVNGESVFMSDFATYLVSDPLPVPGDDDLGSAHRLASLGFSNDYAPFIVPPGTPFPGAVPEPGSLLLLMLGLAGLAGGAQAKKWGRIRRPGTQCVSGRQHPGQRRVSIRILATWKVPRRSIP